MSHYDVVRVFCTPDGRLGNPLGVVRDGSAVPGDAERAALARRLGFSETVFVDDAAAGVVDIFTPTGRLPFAGYPCVGAGRLLDVPQLTTRAGVVPVRRDAAGLTWIAAPAAWAPPRILRQYATAAEVDALQVPGPGSWIYAWAWEDEAAGRVRARGFPGRGDGIDEDEATGAAAMLLTAELGRGLVVTQGRGSQMATAVRPGGVVELGGRVVLAGPGS
ncbi:PhzF family phenazine biosynthesis protein [Yinghuangia soli]|uniref:PhzF family phenazine biosynthesis protein n=1 Tax=Yinghuangia soli TaxID=2908204 RepID=A0AA41Q2E9_9ACTN|nr:PhzF family phenazine biosynthesis protein [Yinghuangia soli]MCF2530305.1 PhzF family phenazine biosynthesis protein [Yinghuangia soli]